MDLGPSTVVMEREAAAEAYADYAAAIKRRHNEEDAAIAKGYKALADGKHLIRLPEVITRGGVDEVGRPRLAVASALTEWVWMARTRAGAVSFAPVESPRQGPGSSWRGVPPRHKMGSGQVNFLDGTLPRIESYEWRLERWGNKAMVPVVPPRLRPTRAMTSYHILFEAEWKPVPPVDPALIRHLAGDLWVLIAEWNLTPLERAVLAERIHP